MTLTNLNYMDSHHSHTTNYAKFMQVTTMGSALTMEWRLSWPPGQAVVLCLSNDSFISLFFRIYKTMFKDMLVDSLSMSTLLPTLGDTARERQ